MPQNFYELVWIFLVYAFIGWCTEVAYAALDTGKFVNRGFLNGPYCPIYGCGVVIVVAALTPLKDNLLILFAGSFLLTTTLEFLTGFLLEKVFHNKWWDYSNFPFNIRGYVCLKFSVYWGLACTFVMDIVHPLIYRLITAVPRIPGTVVLVLLMSVFAVDFVITVATIFRLNRHLAAMDEIAAKIHSISDEIGVRVYENVAAADNIQREYRLMFDENVMELAGELNYRRNVRNEEREKKKRELEALGAKYRQLMAQKNFGFGRLLKAFPDMISRNQNETLQKYREHLNIHFKR